MNDREIMHQALKTLLWANAEIDAWMFDGRGYGPEERPEIIKAVTALQERLAHCDHCGKRLGGEGDIHTCTPKPDAYGYASRLAVAIWEQHYKDVAPQWKPLDDLMGVLTQIDNMTTGLTRLAQPEQEPVAWMMQRGYATGHGDTTEDLLQELEWQVAEREREACAKLCAELHPGLSSQRVAEAIRARGQA